MTAGRVGKPHGVDGSFHVEGAQHPLPLECAVTLDARTHTITRRAGTDDRPIIRLSDLHDPTPLRGHLLLVEAVLADDEWLASDLIGSAVSGHGRVRRVVDGPSCSVLELDDGTLIPFVSDAIRSVGEGVIEVNEEFLG